MIAILTAVYTLTRLIILYKKDIKSIITNILKIGIYAILGVLLSGIITIPLCNVLLSDTRMGSGRPFFLFYTNSYYSKLPGVFLTSMNPDRTSMGYSAPCILAVFLLFKRKKENLLQKVLFIIGIIFMTIPLFGKILNGFSYTTNRWSWAFALVVAYILTTQWDNLLNLEKKD